MKKAIMIMFIVIIEISMIGLTIMHNVNSLKNPVMVLPGIAVVVTAAFLYRTT